MDLELFQNINHQLKPYTKELAYHIVGDPLVVSNLKEYLKVSNQCGLKVNLTTTGNNLTQDLFNVLMDRSLKQVNFSINSYNKNSHKKTLQEYLKPIFSYIKQAIMANQNHFINLRIWNLDENISGKEFNRKVFELINSAFNTTIDVENIYSEKPKNIKIAPKIFLNFDDYFKWPTLENNFISDSGFCYGLDSHFGILASGKVVPCCLDKDGIINLGELTKEPLDEILNSKRAKDIQNGFRNKKVVEELCKKCSYRQRFD